MTDVQRMGQCGRKPLAQSVMVGERFVSALAFSMKLRWIAL